MKQNGFILIVSLIFLVIMSMLGIAMFGGVSMDETMSGNEREKSRALDVAQATLNYADNWLQTNPNVSLGNTLNPGVTCTATTSSAICNNPLTSPTDPTTWISSSSGILPASSVSATGGQYTYASQPKYYVQFLAYAPGTTSTAYYQVTATATGGNNTATTVVQAVYQVKCIVCDAGGP